MPFSSGLEAGGYAGRVQMSPRGPRSLSVPTDLEAQRQFRSTMDKLGQGCGEPMVEIDRSDLVYTFRPHSIFSLCVEPLSRPAR
eukprot:COSAG02_NODE_1831_length_10724_cov_44.091859_5_plen_84_part_00